MVEEGRELMNELVDKLGIKVKSARTLVNGQIRICKIGRF